MDWKAEAEGAPGEEVTLQLMLRVVADVGIVGYPNAGKSSLLAAITRLVFPCNHRFILSYTLLTLAAPLPSPLPLLFASFQWFLAMAQ